MTARRGDESVVFGVLLVCQANVCRSPSAVALFEHRVAATTLAGSLAFGSAGVRPEPAAGWCRAARSYVRRRGCEPSRDHLPRRLDVDLIESADLVLAMSRRERAAIVRLVPTAAPRTFTLVEAGRRGPARGPPPPRGLSGGGGRRPSPMPSSTSCGGSARGKPPSPRS